METSFKNINLEKYLEENRARADEKQKLQGFKFSNHRQEVIQRFVDRINKDREGSKYKAVTWSQVNGQLRTYEIADLGRLFKQCTEAKCFSSLFWWSLKKK